MGVDLITISGTGSYATRGFPKIRGIFLGAPHNQDHRIWGPLLGTQIFARPKAAFPFEHIAGLQLARLLRKLWSRPMIKILTAKPYF